MSEELPPDQQIWEYDFPSNNGLDQQRLITMDSQIGTNVFGSINSLVIIKNNKLVFENYYDNQNRNSLHPIGRASCGLAAIVMGLMMENGFITDLNTPIHLFLPEYQNIFDDEPSKKNITLKHLLTNQMGIPWNEYTENSESPKSEVYKMKLTSDWAKYVLSKRMESPPGLRIVLNSATAIVLAKIFSNILVNLSLEEFIQQELFKPLEISNYQWKSDPSGTLDLATGLSISTFDLTKIGYLMLEEGRWSDRRRIINRDWILDMSNPFNPLDSNIDYGYYWWTFNDEFTFNFVSNHPVYYLMGYQGQSLFFVPDLDMVVAVMGSNYYSNLFYNPSLYIFLEVIQGAIPTAIN